MMNLTNMLIAYILKTGYCLLCHIYQTFQVLLQPGMLAHRLSDLCEMKRTDLVNFAIRIIKVR